MEENITPLKTGIKYGGILGVIGIIITLVEFYAGWQNFEDPSAVTNYYSTISSVVVGLVITFLAIKYYRSNNEGLLTFGEGMSVALFVGLFAGIVGAIFMYIFAAYISPDLGEAVMGSIDKDELSDQEAEAMESMMGFATSPTFMAFSALLANILLSILYGLFCSLILKKQ